MTWATLAAAIVGLLAPVPSLLLARYFARLARAEPSDNDFALVMGCGLSILAAGLAFCFWTIPTLGYAWEWWQHALESSGHPAGHP